jgi:hypothetical protein
MLKRLRIYDAVAAFYGLKMLGNVLEGVKGAI